MCEDGNNFKRSSGQIISFHQNFAVNKSWRNIKQSGYQYYWRAQQGDPGLQNTNQALVINLERYLSEKKYLYTVSVVYSIKSTYYFPFHVSSFLYISFHIPVHYIHICAIHISYIFIYFFSYISYPSACITNTFLLLHIFGKYLYISFHTVHIPVAVHFPHCGCGQSPQHMHGDGFELMTPLSSLGKRRVLVQFYYPQYKQKFAISFFGSEITPSPFWNFSEKSCLRLS